MYKLAMQVMKFGLVGGVAFVIDFVLLLLFTEVFEIHYIISAAFSFIISTVFNYLASMRWVFKSKYKSNRMKELKIFIALSISGLIINEIFMMLFVEKLGIHYMATKIIVTIIVMVWNFVTRKIFLEK